MNEVLPTIIEYGKNGKGKIVHLTNREMDKDGNFVYTLKLVDISNCDYKCNIGGKLKDIKDFYENSKCIAELRFYDEMSIQILIESLNRLYLPELCDAC